MYAIIFVYRKDIIIFMMLKTIIEDMHLLTECVVRYCLHIVQDLEINQHL